MRKVLFLLIVVLLLAACGEEVVEYEDNVEVDGTTFVIEGETTLQDGAAIHYEITNFDVGEILDDGQIEVQDGSFSVKIDASDYPDGEFEIYTAFLPYMQSEEIQGVYGEMGEEMPLGGAVRLSEDMDDLKLIESTSTLTKY